MTIFYFTSTGNCLYVAKRIGGSLYSIPQLMQSKKFKFEDDTIGLIYPTYGFGMPNIVRRFLEQISWQAEYTFAVATYGNKTGAVLHNLEQIAARYGKRFNYMTTLLMVDNYLPNYKVEDQIAKLPEKKTEECLTQIIEDIKVRKENKQSATFSEKLSTAIIQAGAKALMNGKNAQKYIVNGNCTKCGICSKVCPTANIEVKDKVIFLDRCEACLGCVHL